MAGAYFDKIELEGVSKEFIEEVHAAVREITLQRGFGQQVRLNGRPVAEPEPDSDEDETGHQVDGADASRPSSACTTPGGVPSASEADDEASDSDTRRRRRGRGGRRRRDASSSSSSSDRSNSRGGRSGSQSSGRSGRSGGRSSRSASVDGRGGADHVEAGCRPK